MRGAAQRAFAGPQFFPASKETNVSLCRKTRVPEFDHLVDWPYLDFPIPILCSFLEQDFRGSELLGKVPYVPAQRIVEKRHQRSPWAAEIFIHFSSNSILILLPLCVPTVGLHQVIARKECGPNEKVDHVEWTG